jgi:hypothetical protein
MKDQVMLDFETLGTTPDSVVVSLGAVRFTIDGIKEKHEWHFNLNQQLKAKRAVSGDTLIWWMAQGPEAKAVFERSSKTGMAVGAFAQEFAAWLAPLDVRMWGNGATYQAERMIDFFKQYPNAGR